MRMIGQLDGEAKARTFSDYLYVQGIENQIEADKGNSWAVWIHAEEELERARSLLAQFLEKPTDPKFGSSASAANELREKKKQEQAAYEKRVKERRQLFKPMAAYGFGPVTFALIFISVAVFIFTYTQGSRMLDMLRISQVDIGNANDISLWRGLLERLSLFSQVLPEVRHGEVWRLITPIFVHFSFLHIFFNMLWLRDLGSMIEGRQSSLFLLIFVVAVAAVSNVAEYFVLGGGGFGGMSGVVYGLLGYAWIRGRLDPGSGLYLTNYTVWMMIIWFFVCLIGIMGPVANTCHAAGLLMGMAWGFLASLRRR
jgi:GlpG protein